MKGSSLDNLFRAVSTAASNNDNASSRIQRGCQYKRPSGSIGGIHALRLVVVTITLAVPPPDPIRLGFTEHVVIFAVAGREQVKLTWEEKPFSGETVITFAKVAV